MGRGSTGGWEGMEWYWWRSYGKRLAEGCVCVCAGVVEVID
jgi:hypothetical protein